MNWRALVVLHCRDNNEGDVEVFELVGHNDLNEMVNFVKCFFWAEKRVVLPRNVIPKIIKQIRVLEIMIQYTNTVFTPIFL